MPPTEKVILLVKEKLFNKCFSNLWYRHWRNWIFWKVQLSFQFDNSTRKYFNLLLLYVNVQKKYHSFRKQTRIITMKNGYPNFNLMHFKHPKMTLKVLNRLTDSPFGLMRTMSSIFAKILRHFYAKIWTVKKVTFQALCIVYTLVTDSQE